MYWRWRNLSKSHHALMLEVKNLINLRLLRACICWNIKRDMFVYLPVEQCNRRTKQLLNAPLCSRGSSRLHTQRQYAATRWSKNGYITHNESWAKRNEMKNCLNYSTQQKKKRRALEAAAAESKDIRKRLVLDEMNSQWDKNKFNETHRD